MHAVTLKSHVISLCGDKVELLNLTRLTCKVKFGFYLVTMAMRDYVPTLMILPPCVFGWLWMHA